MIFSTTQAVFICQACIFKAFTLGASAERTIMAGPALTQHLRRRERVGATYCWSSVHIVIIPPHPVGSGIRLLKSFKSEHTLR
jgi:hypothetical protein